MQYNTVTQNTIGKEGSPVKQLIPYLTDAHKAADFFQAQRWPEGVICPHCGASGEDIESRGRCPNGLHRYSCRQCAARRNQRFATFTDWTDTIFEGAKLPPDGWLLVIGLWQLGLNAQETAWAAEINPRTAQRACNLLDGSVYETYHLDAGRQLSGVVEADELYQTAGHKGATSHREGDERAPRRRALKERGRGSWDKDRPPVLGLVQRRAKSPDGKPEPVPAQVYLEVTPDVQTNTIKPIITARVVQGSELHTDEYRIYKFADEAGYDHHTVNHGAGEYARQEEQRTVHCNTIEGLWASLRLFLDRFRGISKNFLHLRVARFEFLHNHGHLDCLTLVSTALKHIFKASADYWRWMVHQRRRIPLTGCYR
jgi:transposase-like protein